MTLKERLAALSKRLEMEGRYTDAIIVELALGALKAPRLAYETGDKKHSEVSK